MIGLNARIDHHREVSVNAKIQMSNNMNDLKLTPNIYCQPVTLKESPSVSLKYSLKLNYR